MNVLESQATRNAEIGDLEEAEIPGLEERKQLAESFRGDALHHRRLGTQPRLERHAVA